MSPNNSLHPDSKLTLRARDFILVGIFVIGSVFAATQRYINDLAEINVRLVRIESKLENLKVDGQ